MKLREVTVNNNNFNNYKKYHKKCQIKLHKYNHTFKIIKYILKKTFKVYKSFCD